MSALPRPPLYDLPPEPPAPRRARWKRVAAWTFAGIAILLVVLVIVAILVLRSQRFHQYVLRTAQEQATAALGSRVQARDYTLSWSGISPRVDMYDVVVAGAPPYSTPPLLQVDHIALAVKVTSLLRRTFYVEDITVNHPVVHVFVDAHGTDNLPQTKSTAQKEQSKTSIFDLGVRHALLDRGEIYYNNRKSALDADLHDVNFQAAFSPAQKRYSGTLAYREGRVRMEGTNPIPHALQARFALTPQAFTLERAVLSSGPSQFVLSARVEDFVHPRATATYEATLDSGQFRLILKNPSLPAGVIHAAGDLSYAAKPDVPMLDAIVLNGDLSSRALTVENPGFRGDIRDIAAHYSVASGNLEVRDIRALLLGGELNGTLTMRNLAGNSHSNLKANLRGVSLAQVRSMMNSPAMKNIVLTGHANATADASWGKTMNDLVARTDATLQGSMQPATGGKVVPLNGVVHARYSAPRKEVTLADSYLRSAQTSLTLNGTVSDSSALQVQLKSQDLHELETVADLAQSPTAAKTAVPLGLYGTASFVGAVRGSTSAPRLTGQLNAGDLRVRGSAWKLLRANVDVSPSNAVVQNGTLQPADRGNINFNARAGLRKWAFTDSSPFQVALKASNVNVANLVNAAGSQAPVSGTLAADVNVSGTQLNPVGRGTVSLTRAKVSGQPVDSLNVNFQGTGEQVNAKLALQIPKAGNAHGTLIYFPKQQGYEAQLQATGINLAQLEAVKAKNMDLTGVLNLTASGRGTLKNPGLQATAQIPKLAVHGQTISGLTLQTTVANHVANFAFDSEVVNTSARGRGTVQLVGDYYANANIDTQAIPLAPLVAAFAPAQAGNFTGQTELHATLRGPLRNKSLLDAHATIPTLAVDYKRTVQLAAARPIQIDFSKGVLTIQRSQIRGTGTDLQFEGSIPTNSSAPASLLLQGAVDLRLAQLINPDVTSSGQLQFDINSYGRRSDANVQGQVKIVNATFATADLPLGLQNGNGVLTLTKDRLNVTQFTGTVGGGTVKASGGVVYRPAVAFDLALAGNGIRMLYEGGVRVGANTTMTLTGTPDSAALRGQVRIDQLQFTPDFDLQEFMGQLGGGEATPPPGQGFSSNLALDIGVHSAGGINLVSRTMSLDGAANLRVTGTAAEPVILGRINLNGGDLIFMGNRYVLQGGTIDFINPSRTEPVVNVGVNTTVDQYNIQMRFWGPADHLHTNYSSDPALPPSDIINLIAFGKTTEASAANPTPPGTLGAQSLVASQVSGQVTSRVGKLAGLSQLSIDPVLGGSGQNPGARVAIQQRVTSKFFVDFATDVTSTQGQVIKLEYQATPRVSISGSRNQNGGFGADVRIRKSW